MGSQNNTRKSDYRQSTMFPASPPVPLTASKRLDGSLVIEPLGKGLRVTGRDSSGAVLWGFVATRTMLEQPHGSIAIYDRLRELLNDDLESAGLPVDRPENIFAAARSEIDELERVVARLKRSLNAIKETSASDGQRDKAHDLYRSAHDLLQWMSQEMSVARLAEDNGEKDKAAES